MKILLLEAILERNIIIYWHRVVQIVGSTIRARFPHFGITYRYAESKALFVQIRKNSIYTTSDINNSNTYRVIT